jgi:hypothetical protein
MANHLHVLIRVPEPPQLSDEQLLERLDVLCGKKGTLTLLAWQALQEQGRIYKDVRARLIERMGDASAFMKELKQRFNRWYNHRHNRFGALWAEHREEFGQKRKDGARERMACENFKFYAARSRGIELFERTNLQNAAYQSRYGTATRGPLNR